MSDEQEKSVATFIARLIYCGMSTESAVLEGFRYAVALLQSYEQVSVRLRKDAMNIPVIPEIHETMREASFLLSSAMPEVPKWLAAWQLNEQDGKESQSSTPA